MTVQYPKQDHEELGDYYLRHVDAMTGEGLHRKSDIAAQLAWRDLEIDRLRALLKEFRQNFTRDDELPDLLTRIDFALERLAKKRIDELKPGDRVDLENDVFADPGGTSRNHFMFECEWQVVAECVRETPGCICVYFENFTCGFPPSHLVTVDQP